VKKTRQRGSEGPLEWIARARKELKEQAESDNAAAALARKRWDKATPEERRAVNEMLLKARSKKREGKK